MAQIVIDRYTKLDERDRCSVEDSTGTVLVCQSEDEGPEDENAIWMAQTKAPVYWIGVMSEYEARMVLASMSGTRYEVADPDWWGVETSFAPLVGVGHHLLLSSPLEHHLYYGPPCLRLSQ